MVHTQWLSLVLVSLTIINIVSSTGIIIEGPSNNTVNIGDVVTLKCRTSRVVDVEWVRGENTLNTTLPSERPYYSVDGNNSLTIHNITLNSISRIPDKYMCIVKNATGGILERSRRGWLFVRFLKVPQKIVQPVTMYVGIPNIPFYMLWSGYPVPNVSLQFPPSVAPFQHNVTYKTSTFTKGVKYFGRVWMTFGDVNSSKFSGNYTVVVDNGYEKHTVLVGILIVKTLPAAPTIRLELYLYSNIRLFFSFPKGMSGISNITLPVALRAKGKLVRQFNISHIVASTNEVFYPVADLNNGTTYTVEARTKTNAGLSNNTTIANITIPRMVAPGPPRNLSVTVTSRFNGISLTIYYYRPADDGGTKFLRGDITNCIVDRSNGHLRECTTDEAVLGSSSKGYNLYDDLKGETKYYFSINFLSDAVQHGRPASMYFTTPSREDSSKGGLSTAVIVSIACSSLVVFVFLLRGSVAMCRYISKRGESVTSVATNESTERLIGEE